jgi:hypothetical protein
MYEKELVHLPDQFIDVGFPVTKVATLNKMLKLPCSPATSRVGKLKGPEEIRRLQKIIIYSTS